MRSSGVANGPWRVVSSTTGIDGPLKEARHMTNDQDADSSANETGRNATPAGQNVIRWRTLIGNWGILGLLVGIGLGYLNRPSLMGARVTINDILRVLSDTRVDPVTQKYVEETLRTMLTWGIIGAIGVFVIGTMFQSAMRNRQGEGAD